MSSKLLIVHSSRMARSIMRRLLLAEAPEYTLVEAEDGQQATQYLREHSFDAVICDEVLSDVPGLSFIEALRKTDSGAATGVVVILSETTSQANRQNLLNAGIDKFLQVPFTGEQMAAIVRSTQTPRKLRVHHRVSIPGAKATFCFNERPAEGNIVNLSLNGMLIEFNYEFNLGDVFQVAAIDLDFPPEFATEAISNLRGRMIRVQVLTHRADYLPERIHSAWQFVGLSESDLNKLKDIIQLADPQDDLAALESSQLGRAHVAVP